MQETSRKDEAKTYVASLIARARKAQTAAEAFTQEDADRLAAILAQVFGGV